MEILIQKLSNGYTVRHTPRMMQPNTYVATSLEEALTIAGHALGMAADKRVTIEADHGDETNNPGDD